MVTWGQMFRALSEKFAVIGEWWFATHYYFFKTVELLYVRVKYDIKRNIITSDMQMTTLSWQ